MSCNIHKDIIIAKRTINKEKCDNERHESTFNNLNAY